MKRSASSLTLLAALAISCGASGCSSPIGSSAVVPFGAEARMEKRIAEKVKDDPFPTATEAGVAGVETTVTR